MKELDEENSIEEETDDLEKNGKGVTVSSNRSETYTDNSLQPDKIYFDLEKLKIIGILQCDGDTYERLTELYHVLQDNDQESIASNDKDTVRILKLVFDFSTKLVIKHLRRDEDLRKESIKISQARVEQARELYDEIIEDFIDSVFGYDSLLKKEQWKQ